MSWIQNKFFRGGALAEVLAVVGGTEVLKERSSAEIAKVLRKKSK